MAAYSAVISFEQLVKQLLNSAQFPLDSQKPQIQSLHDKISSLQSSLERIFPAPKNERSTANELGIRIRDAIYTAQDTIESFIFSQSLSEEQSSASISLQEIIANIDPIIIEVEKLAGCIRHGEEDSAAADVSQTYKSSSSSKSNRIIGQDRDKKLVTDELLSDEDKLQVIPISGMAGIGKTTLARSIYDDPHIKSQFPFRAWVTVSQDYHVGEILAKLLNSIESRGQKAGDRVFQGSEEQLRLQLHQALYNNKYLVVIDDMWEQSIWDSLRNSLPDNKNRSRILLTTRILTVAKYAKSSKFYHEMQPLGEEDSWTLLCEKTFGGMQCPPHLEKIGREIAKNCRGLPLSITVIGGLLSQERKTEDYWRSIEEDTYAAANKKVEDSYKEILSLSYNHLPSKLKGCFLYMGAFPEDSEIFVSKLIKLWVAEGFLIPPSPPQVLENVAEQSLEDLIDRNLVVIRKNTSDGHRIKTCGMHDSLRELAEKECGKEKFFHSRKKYAQKPGEDAVSTNAQRRISVHKNILMCLEEVYKSTKIITQARTLLYVGPHHHHPLPFCLTFDLLRVLDALTVYFIQFPSEFAKLIHLRYLSFTYNGKLSSSLSKLHKLQVLIVRRQPKIIFVGQSFLPDEIWNMPELRHLLFTESDLPEIPRRDSVLLANLQSLSNVNVTSCPREVLQSMPDLKKITMWMEAPGAIGLYLDELKHLEAFKFTVLNPIPKSKVEFQPKLFFPKTISKLSLSGCGLLWEDMKIIGELPLLEVLKLRELAFQGEEWCPEDYIFDKLKYLLIEYLDFKRWNADDSHFPRLERLFIRHCYELEGIPPEFGELGYLELIELVDCSPDAVDSAEYIKVEQEKFDNQRLEVRIYSSWE